MISFVASYRQAAVAALIFSIATAAHAAVPDISGPWIAARPGAPLTTSDGTPPPLLPAAAAAYAANKAAINTAKDSDPDLRCLPPGVPRLMLQPFPFNIVQGKTMYAMLFEWNHLNRIIHFVPGHSETIGPLYLGQSIGHWSGNTLMVDTNSFNDVTWLDDTGLPHSDALHTIEQIKLTHGGEQLSDTVTIDDPKTYSKSWSTVLQFRKDPGVIITEDYCLGRLQKDRLLTR